jgi:hypothetical protein
VSHGGSWQPPDPTSGPLPIVDLEEASSAPPPRRKSPGVVIAATVGSVAIAAAAIFGVSRVLGGGDAGGAATPEQAGLDLLTAIENEDVLGAIDVLLPGERETLRAPITELIDELTRLEVLSAEADLSAISGVDIVFEDERATVAETNVDDIVNVDLVATASATVDGEQLPIGDLVLDNVEGELSELDTDAPPEDTGEPLRITAVEEDGRWYLSLFHTIAETARAGAAEPADIPDEGVAPAGGDSPEDAFDNLLAGIEALDVEQIIATVNPEEFQALQRYAPIFLADAQATLDQSVEESGVSISIADPEYTVSGSGDTRSVSIDYFRVEVTADGETVIVEYEDGCYVATGGSEGEVVNSCDLSNQANLDEMFENPEVIQDLLSTLEGAFDDYEDAGLVVERVDGQWYFSPFSTLSENLLAVLRALDRGEIESVIEEASDAFDAGLGDMVFGQELVTIDEEGEDTSDSLPPDTSVPSTVEDPSGVCYTESTGEAASVCFQELIDAGEIDPSVVPVYVRFPECGLADVFWSGDYTSLPDADFTAIIEETAPCFQQLVASGELDESELPLELSHPQCLDGRNWYTAIEDEEYSDAVYDCAFG